MRVGSIGLPRGRKSYAIMRANRREPLARRPHCITLHFCAHHKMVVHVIIDCDDPLCGVQQIKEEEQRIKIIIEQLHVVHA